MRGKSVANVMLQQSESAACLPAEESLDAALTGRMWYGGSE